MQPLRFGKKDPKATLPAGMIIDPKKAKGPRLTLEPILDRVFITAPEDENFDPNMEGAIHLPGVSARKLPGYTIVEALSVGPNCTAIKKGDRVFVLPAQCQLIAYDGNHYYWVNEAMISGIIRG